MTISPRFHVNPDATWLMEWVAFGVKINSFAFFAPMCAANFLLVRETVCDMDMPQRWTDRPAHDGFLA